MALKILVPETLRKSCFSYYVHNLHFRVIQAYTFMKASELGPLGEGDKNASKNSMQDTQVQQEQQLSWSWLVSERLEALARLRNFHLDWKSLQQL